ncbi:hypothetical protein Dimus_023467 [Dionaea muscipula]
MRGQPSKFALRGHANLLCIVPILSDVSKETIVLWSISNTYFSGEIDVVDVGKLRRFSWSAGLAVQQGVEFYTHRPPRVPSAGRTTPCCSSTGYSRTLKELHEHSQIESSCNDLIQRTLVGCNHEKQNK